MMNYLNKGSIDRKNNSSKYYPLGPRPITFLSIVVSKSVATVPLVLSSFIVKFIDEVVKHSFFENAREISLDFVIQFIDV